MENINFTPNDILQKEFRQKMRGYDPNDVDSFLDDIIKDYESFTKQNQSLADENERLRIRVDELNKQVAIGGGSGQSPLTRSSVSQPMSSATNMDILKRLSNLERRVFGSQLDNGNDSHRL
ncbi:cell division regulator GpsB [Lentilactobacillus kribbianus]|uniref:cell division regulator GpsB n=1 Tax=Lentilactobacillus kribbianus TaxID=2729622 RepID=UPI001553F52C|nr:cell division regulator GpsB [Lentilactobacillus kribbianus]